MRSWIHSFLEFPQDLLWRSTQPFFIQFLPSVLSFEELGARPVLTVWALFHVRLVWLSLARIVQSLVSIIVQDRPACLIHSGQSVYRCAWIFSFWFLLAKATVALLCTSLQLCCLVSAKC
jgi:hypothetical protein